MLYSLSQRIEHCTEVSWARSIQEFLISRFPSECPTCSAQDPQEQATTTTSRVEHELQSANGRRPLHSPETKSEYENGNLRFNDSQETTHQPTHKQSSIRDKGIHRRRWSLFLGGTIPISILIYPSLSKSDVVQQNKSKFPLNWGNASGILRFFPFFFVMAANWSRNSIILYYNCNFPI